MLGVRADTTDKTLRVASIIEPISKLLPFLNLCFVGKLHLSLVSSGRGQQQFGVRQTGYHALRLVRIPPLWGQLRKLLPVTRITAFLRIHGIEVNADEAL